MTNCPLPGETLPKVTIDRVTIHPVPPHVVAGGDLGTQGVEIHVQMSARQVIEDDAEESWLQDEDFLKYLKLRVIQVRRPEAEKFLVGAIGDLTRRGLIGTNFSPWALGSQILEKDERFYAPGGFLDYAAFSYTHKTANQNRGINTPQGYLAYVKAINLGKMFSESRGGGSFLSWKIYYPTLEESQGDREPAEFPWPEDRPPYTEFVAPGWLRFP